jgi:hypothetical protein
MDELCPPMNVLSLPIEELVVHEIVEGREALIVDIQFWVWFPTPGLINVAPATDPICGLVQDHYTPATPDYRRE